MHKTPARNHRRLKRILAVVAVDLVVLSIIFSALEIYYRRTVTYITPAEHDSIFGGGSISAPVLLVVDAPDGRRMIPNANVVIKAHPVSGLDVLMQTNSLGFRGPEVPEHKASNEIRILALGDSITWGSYLPAEHIYVARIGHYLEQLNPDRKYTMINAGIEDVGTREEVDILERRGLTVRPDVVILAFYLNDSRPSWGFAQEADSYGYVLRHSIFLQTICQRLVFRKWIKEKGADRFAWIPACDDPRWKTDHGRFLKLAGLAQYDWGAAWQDDSWSTVQPVLERLKVDAEKNGFQVVVVAFPVAFQVYSDFVEDYPQQVLSRKATDLGFYYLDLLPMLRSHKDEMLFYDQCHPRAQTNDYIGHAIAEFLAGGVLGQVDSDNSER
ncbi:MAG TPA: SGNH/GDSL hydrolase family protein [bacterium]|nr:SGNH/GDSL hydrolase family protein [bacterium]